MEKDIVLCPKFGKCKVKTCPMPKTYNIMGLDMDIVVPSGYYCARFPKKA